jgi:hypothetical protein
VLQSGPCNAGSSAIDWMAARLPKSESFSASACSGDSWQKTPNGVYRGLVLAGEERDKQYVTRSSQLGNQEEPV